ncbi:MAG: 16S rRNA (guanine(966)-N(2))-methyltransferase RsmD [Shewanellaceae bacterium]|nr:16S rRNA (guanine(966)-N(2))-methyltransferase RsmD [Shewanellaceae bacterium]
MQKNRKKSLKQPAGCIRIIGGQWRGRKIPVIDVEGLRPTTDRMKETLFNWLMPYLAEARILDLFSGSGALAFEALSRYAQYALLCEKNMMAAQQLEQHLDLLKCENADVYRGDSIAMLQHNCKQAFDIIFLDPPYRQSLITSCLDLIEKGQWLKPSGILFIEIEQEAPAPSLGENWLLLKEKRAGQSRFQLWQFQHIIPGLYL